MYVYVYHVPSVQWSKHMNKEMGTATCRQYMEVPSPWPCHVPCFRRKKRPRKRPECWSWNWRKWHVHSMWKFICACLHTYTRTHECKDIYIYMYTCIHICIIRNIYIYILMNFQLARAHTKPNIVTWLTARQHVSAVNGLGLCCFNFSFNQSMEPRLSTTNKY